MPQRPKLAFFVLQTQAGWIVQADGFTYPPWVAFADALGGAIREARAARRCGFASIVLAQTGMGRPCRVRWTADDDMASPVVADGVSAVNPMVVYCSPVQERSGA